MRKRISHQCLRAAVVFLACKRPFASLAASDEELAKQLQNPVVSLISVPFQINFDFGGGYNDQAFRYQLNFQPVIPISLGKDWNPSVVLPQGFPLLERRWRSACHASRAMEAAFKEQEHTGLDVWKREFTNLRAPNIYNLQSDPFERGPESFEYGKWMADGAFLIVPSQAVVGKWLESFKEFPIRQKPASFNLDGVIEKLTAPPAGK